MSTIGRISEESEKPSDLHMVDWWLAGVALVLVVSTLVVLCSLNSYWTGDPMMYTERSGTTYVPPEEKKSK